MRTSNVRGESIEATGQAYAKLPVRRVNGWFTCGLVTMGLLGCESRDVVLGRGSRDSFSSDSFGSADATSRELDRPEATSEALSVAVASTSSLESTSAPSELSSGDGRLTTSSTSEGNTSGDVCDDIYSKCADETPGVMCLDVLIFCRIVLPDGGPPCDEVYAQCVQMGYSEPDCEHAADTCEDGGGRILGPDVDSTLQPAD